MKSKCLVRSNRRCSFAIEKSSWQFRRRLDKGKTPTVPDRRGIGNERWNVIPQLRVRNQQQMLPVQNNGKSPSLLFKEENYFNLAIYCFFSLLLLEFKIYNPT